MDWSFLVLVGLLVAFSVLGWVLTKLSKDTKHVLVFLLIVGFLILVFSGAEYSSQINPRTGDYDIVLSDERLLPFAVFITWLLTYSYLKDQGENDEGERE